MTGIWCGFILLLPVLLLVVLAMVVSWAIIQTICWLAEEEDA